MNLLMMFPEVNTDELKAAIKNNKISNFDVLSQIMSKVSLKFKTKLLMKMKTQKHPIIFSK